MRIARLLSAGAWEVLDSASAMGGAIAVVLTAKDRENIANMHPDATCYIQFEGRVPREEAERHGDELKRMTS